MYTKYTCTSYSLLHTEHLLVQTFNSLLSHCGSYRKQTIGCGPQAFSRDASVNSQVLIKKMRLYYCLTLFVCVSFVIAIEQDKKQKDHYDEEEDYSENPDGLDLMTGKVETVSPGLDFNSFSELYDYLKEAEESDNGAHDEDQIDQAQNIRLVLMTDGDTLTLDSDSSEENTPTVQGTIDEMTKESPELDLMQNGVLVGEDEQLGDADQPKIMATEADWTFIQDTLKKLDQKESLLAKLVNYETHDAEPELSENERRGKEIYEKAQQITTVTRTNKKLAHNLYLDAAQLGYIPAKEKVAWFQLLGSASLLELDAAKKSFEELMPYGQPETQMVNLILKHLILCSSGTVLIYKLEFKQSNSYLSTNILSQFYLLLFFYS